MREIKFRLVREGKVVGYEIHKAGGAKFVSIMHSPDGYEWKNIGYFDRIDHDHKDQFTGLKDKNAKEIFEGDLVKLATGAGLFEIVFENGCWSYISGPGSYAWRLYEHVRPGCDYLNLEVVYHVYENPELLK